MMRKMIAALVLVSVLMGVADSVSAKENSWKFVTTRYAKNSTFGILDNSCVEIFAKDIEPMQAIVITEPRTYGDIGIMDIWYTNAAGEEWYYMQASYTVAPHSMCAKYVVSLPMIVTP